MRTKKMARGGIGLGGGFPASLFPLALPPPADGGQRRDAGRSLTSNGPTLVVTFFFSYVDAVAHDPT
jgi:hypothetical protein